jgi:hypothetical protein
MEVPRDKLMTQQDLVELSRSPEFAHLELALESKQVSFTHVVETYYGCREGFNAMRESQREAYKELYPRVLRAFTEAQGGVHSQHYCRRSLSAVVLTRRNEIYAVFPLDRFKTLEFQTLLSELRRLYVRCRHSLKGGDLVFCLERLFSMWAYLLQTLDEASSLEKIRAENAVDVTEASDPIVVRILKDEVDLIRSFLQRRAVLHYILGMFLGVLFGLVVLSVLTLGLKYFSGLPIVSVLPPFSSLVAGGIGAVVSVMSRMTFGRFGLPDDIRTNAMVMGVFRPAVGAIFGILIYALLEGGLLPIKVMPQSSTGIICFYSSLAFIAGFSERWAQEMLVVAETYLSSGKKESRLTKNKSGSDPTQSSASGPSK